VSKERYFAQLSRRVRWRLPPKEAEEALADYDEILENFPSEDKKQLHQELGTPAQAARSLGTAEVYLHWLLAFSAMMLCLVVPAFLLLVGQHHGHPEGMVIVFYLAGVAISLVWFWPGRAPRYGFFLPWKLFMGLLTLLLTAVVIVFALYVFYGLISGQWEVLPPQYFGPVSIIVLRACGGIAALLGVAGLIEARMDDRRWRALYIMALTVMFLCDAVMAHLTGLNIPATGTAAYAEYMLRWAQSMGILSTLGLVGTVAALC